jgi:hypothetical protein
VLVPVTLGQLKSIQIADISMFLVHQGQSAVDIFTKSAKNYRLKFQDIDFPIMLQMVQVIGSRFTDSNTLTSGRVAIESTTARWVSGRLSNFDYIIQMNLVAGRSFRDPAYYPLAPAILRIFNDPKSIVTHYRGVKFEEPPQTILSLENCFIRPALILPELFFDPTAISPQAELPTWAHNRFEFVYLARKILESTSFTPLLPEWIDWAFGCKSPSSHSISRLFQKSHPLQDTSAETPRDLRYEINLSNTIKHATIFTVKPHLIKLGVVSDDLQFYSIGCDYQPQTLICTCDLIGVIDCKRNDIVFSQSAVGYAYSRSESALFFLQEDDLTKTVPLFCPTPLFASCGRAILYSPDRFAIFRFVLRSESNVYLCHSRTEIDSIAASQAHQIVALETIDGVVLIHDAKNGTQLGRYETGGPLAQVLVTDSWGFVLALRSRVAFVFSVNGEFIKKETLAVPVTRAFAHTSVHGSDFVSFLTASDEVGVFDALFPSAQTMLAKSQYQVVVVLYDPLHRMILACNTTGLIQVYAYSPDEG